MLPLKRYLNARTAPFLLSVFFFAYSSGLWAQSHNSFISNGRSIDIAAFNADMETMMHEVEIPGMSIAIIDSNQVVFSHNYGYKQTGPNIKVNGNTTFEAASLTKIFLVFAVQELVQEGRFDLSKPMYQYLEYPRLEHDPRYKLITPTMILSHCSGIENWQRENNPDTLEIVSNPGEKFVYSGEGFQYLALVIEKLLQEPYEAYIDSLVLRPVGIGDTWFKYYKTETGQEVPADYALGYDEFGSVFEKTKDAVPVPASGAQTTAGEYAKLIIGLFNGRYLTPATVSDMLRPVIRIKEDNNDAWMCSGLAVIYSGGDTIVSFSGSNAGFKGELFYSVPHKKGFVFFTNSDRGNMIIQHICNRTAGLDIAWLFAPSFYEQYPSTAIRLFHLYKEKGADALLAETRRLKAQGKLGEKTLDELGDTFMGHDKKLAVQLLEENISMYPKSAIAYGLLGNAYLEDKRYDLAYKDLQMASKLHFDLWDITPLLKECQEKIASNH